MRVVRVYDRPGAEQWAEELRDVREVHVTRAGALAVELEHGDRPGTLRGVIIAPLDWHRVEDWNATDDGDQDQPEPAAREPWDPPVFPAEPYMLPEQPQPGYVPRLEMPRPSDDRGRVLVDEPTVPALPRLDFPTVGIVRDPLALSDARRLQLAMLIHCICAELRCPSLLYVGTDLPGDPEQRQCDQRADHPGEHTSAGRWMWGPHNHHPECHRHPSRYNRNGNGEVLCGRPVMVEGAPMIGTGCLLPADHTGAHDYATPITEGQPEQPAGLTVARELVAALPTQRERSAAAAALRAPAAAWPVVAAPTGERVGEVLSGLVEPRPLLDHVLAAHSSPDWFRARTLGQQCAAPEGTGLGVTCERPAGHDYGPHAAMTTAGDLIQW